MRETGRESWTEQTSQDRLQTERSGTHSFSDDLAVLIKL